MVREKGTMGRDLGVRKTRLDRSAAVQSGQATERDFTVSGLKHPSVHSWCVCLCVSECI